MTRKKLLALLVLAATVLSVSLFYYVSPKSPVYEAAELEKTLKDFHWKRPAETSVFDCSEMSGFLWQHLTNRGWKCAIAISHERSHAWLIVNTIDEFITPVEAVNAHVIRRNDSRYEEYTKFDIFFPTLQQALNWSYDEFDYWNTYPYPP